MPDDNVSDWWFWEEWVTYSTIEEGSRTSGWFSWALGRVTPNVIAHFDRMDEEAQWTKYERFEPGTKLRHIAEFVLHSLGIDSVLPVRAVLEHLVRGAYTITDDLLAVDGSSTAINRLSVKVDVDELPDFLELLRKGDDTWRHEKIGPWIDAVLDPDGPAGAERARIRALAQRTGRRRPGAG